MKRILCMLASSSIFILGLSGCGSDATTTKSQQKTATITFSTVSSAHIAPLLGIQMSAKLPEGVSFTDLSTALVGRNDTGSLIGSTYTPSTRTVSFTVASPTAPVRFGTFAELKCDITPGYALAQSSFESINSPFPDLQMEPSSATEDLTLKIPVKLSVSFGY